jgi:hypothetical protein
MYLSIVLLILKLTVCSTTCRLPQTPRTPGSAAAHYFDDVFTTSGRPKKPHQLRRSSTSRSIGFRSDNEDSVTGDEDERDEAEPSQAERRSSVGYLDDESVKEKLALQQRMNHYVSGQLARHKNGHTHVEKDELVSSLDGASESKSNGHSSRRSRGTGEGYFEQDPYFSK